MAPRRRRKPPPPREGARLPRETQPGKESEWSDSMSCLMKKLEELNLDIEEALSAGSSPSSTPSAKRHKLLVTPSSHSEAAELSLLYLSMDSALFKWRLAFMEIIKERDLGKIEEQATRI
ncbi:rho GTPase-activating protein 7-like isoform X2 [Apteryx rowi]|uniref:rho GTPase-activating protein 7-like isoform X2 n=1 Tax=Apteryx rowi TaxID=308060 RepID=UPI000E1DCEF8|nr:rho GTPase-activating protein 7-like isoform X2 [Apteryx rowi]